MFTQKSADLLRLIRAILTVFQIQDAASDPLTRTAALCSLVSALMSLSYGIMYIVRFGNMRSMYRASRWAEVFSRLLGLTSYSYRPNVGGAKDRNLHLLERLGLTRLAWGLARMVCACIHRCDHVICLAQWCQRRVAPCPVAGSRVRPTYWGHVPVAPRAGVLRPRDTDVQQLWRDRAEGTRRAAPCGRTDRVRNNKGRVGEGG